MQGIACIRINDGCRRINGFKKIIPVKQPFDWIMAFSSVAAAIDTKRQAKGMTFVASKIDPNQVSKMMELDRQGVIAGYVVYTMAINRLYFIPVSMLHLSLASGLSIRLIEQLDLGTLENSDLKRIFQWTGSGQS